MDSDATPAIARFEFAWDVAYRMAALPFGILPATTGVVVSPAELMIRFGPWSLRTPRSNVIGVHRTDDYAFVKTAGPPHLSFADRGVTFATNGRHGLCIAFRERVPAIDPTKTITHPAATVTVADVDRLVAALSFDRAGE